MNKLKLITSPKSVTTMIILLVILAVASSIQVYIASLHQHLNETIHYTRYNNYVIFKQSFEHLILNKNLYLPYPQEYFDLFKYSPTFAFIIAPFYYMPDWLGIAIFNLINVVVLISALKNLNILKPHLFVVYLFLLIEMGIALTSTQTNILIAGLIIWAFIYMEKQNYFWAIFFICLSAYIKIFGIVAFSLFLLYPNKLKVAAYSIFWIIVMFLLPLIITHNFTDLLQQYKNWGVLLQQDHSNSTGFSVMGILDSWFNLNISKPAVVAIGAIAFLAPFLQWKNYQNINFRLLMLSSVLIWIVIFNHRAESPTFIIALTGIVIYYYTVPKSKINDWLFILSLIFTSFISTDLITPGKIYAKYFEPYAIKALFSIIIWIKLIYEVTLSRKYLLETK